MSIEVCIIVAITNKIIMNSQKVNMQSKTTF